MDLSEKLKNKLSILNNLYDIVRIIDPINKKTFIVIDNKLEKTKNNCYDFWGRNSFCKKCISIKAYVNNDTYLKIDSDRDDTFLVMASPFRIYDKTYILEALKNISQEHISIHNDGEIEYNLENLICDVKEKLMKDELTGLYNRRYINQSIPIQMRDSMKLGQPLSIIMADIDGFKKINDTYGHVVGDNVIKDFAVIIKEYIRDNVAWAARYGGDEFFIVLTNLDKYNAFKVADSIRKVVENYKFSYGNINIKVTSSFGVYTIVHSMDLMDMIKKMDNNLYNAKRKGKNMVYSEP